MLEACRLNGWKKHTVMVLEYKASGSLIRSEWLYEIERVNAGYLKGGAKTIGQQKRKYLVNSTVRVIVAFDGSSIAAVKAKFRDRQNWQSSRQMKVDVLFEDQEENFSRLLLAFIMMGVEHHFLNR